MPSIIKSHITRGLLLAALLLLVPPARAGGQDPPPVSVPKRVLRLIASYLRETEPLRERKALARAVSALDGKLDVAARALRTLPPMTRGRPGTRHGRRFTFAGRTWEFSIHLPKGYNNKRRFPVLVLPDHAKVSPREGIGWWIGRTGTDSYILFRPEIIKHQSDEKRFPRPQFFERDQDMARVMKEAIRVLRLNYAIEHDRLIMTGLSQAGYYTWYYAVSYPDEFAGIVPESAGGPAVRAAVLPLAPNLASMGVRILHTKGDRITPYTDATAMEAALKKAGAEVDLVSFTRRDYDGRVPPNLHPIPWQFRARNILPWGLGRKRVIPNKFSRVLRYQTQQIMGRWRINPPTTVSVPVPITCVENNGRLNSSDPDAVYLVSPEDVLAKKEFLLPGAEKGVRPKADLVLLLQSFKELADPQRLVAAEIHLAAK